MKVSHTVKLELLRHGHPHNQLLSPLTRYIGLSGRHEPVTITLPFEHYAFSSRLRALQYKGTDSEGRRSELQQMATTLGDLFEQVPGLLADLSQGEQGDHALTHLRLVFSASELALLPFEVCAAPSGFPGEGRALSLQLDAPLVLTREIRGASGDRADWSRVPRILFVAAAPGANDIPFKGHLVALVKALDPWLDPKKSDQTAQDRLKDHLTVINNASLHDIRQACAKVSYTHIHILAHGASCGEREAKRYGLHLFSSPGQDGHSDVVDGRRLAHALRGHHHDPRNGLSQPLVVTVASCDSGYQGSVIWPGASLAHDLHEAGIPFVVASQFPLSKRGSIQMADTLYRSLLWGKDPRICLHELRQRLASDDVTTHDWASIVAYLSPPVDFHGQIEKLRTLQGRRVIRKTLARIQDYTGDSTDHSSKYASTVSEREFQQALDLVNQAIDWVPDAAPESDTRLRKTLVEHANTVATLGSAEKRQAQVIHLRREKIKNTFKDEHQTTPMYTAYKQEAQEALQRALVFYRRAFDLDTRCHWAAVQWLGIKAHTDVDNGRKIDIDQTVWNLAYAAAVDDLNSDDDSIRAWACGSLAELYFLIQKRSTKKVPAPQWGPIPELETKDATTLAQTFAKQIIAIVGPTAFETKSTYWQFKRYRDRFRLGRPYDALAAKLVELLKCER